MATEQADMQLDAAAELLGTGAADVAFDDDEEEEELLDLGDSSDFEGYAELLSDDKDAAGEQQEEEETDPARLKARQKQIDYGKNTIGYERYLQAVPKALRKRRGKNTDPPTPDIRRSMSKKTWDGIVKVWRRHLHKYDHMDEAAALAAAEALRQRVQQARAAKQARAQQAPGTAAAAAGVAADFGTPADGGHDHQPGSWPQAAPHAPQGHSDPRQDHPPRAQQQQQQQQQTRGPALGQPGHDADGGAKQGEHSSSRQGQSAQRGSSRAHRQHGGSSGSSQRRLGMGRGEDHRGEGHQQGSRRDSGHRAPRASPLQQQQQQQQQRENPSSHPRYGQRSGWYNSRCDRHDGERRDHRYEKENSKGGSRSGHHSGGRCDRHTDKYRRADDGAAVREEGECCDGSPNLWGSDSGGGSSKRRMGGWSGAHEGAKGMVEPPGSNGGSSGRQQGDFGGSRREVWGRDARSERTGTCYRGGSSSSRAQRRSREDERVRSTTQECDRADVGRGGVGLGHHHQQQQQHCWADEVEAAEQECGLAAYEDHERVSGCQLGSRQQGGVSTTNTHTASNPAAAVTLALAGAHLAQQQRAGAGVALTPAKRAAECLD